MRCSRVRQLIEDHVDGLLAAPEAERVRLHLDGCADCAGEAEDSRMASASLAAWNDMEPPAGCFDAIMARIDALPPEALHRAPEPSLRLRLVRGAAFRWIASGAVAAATFLIGMNITLDRTPDAPVRVIVPTAPRAIGSTDVAGDRGGAAGTLGTLGAVAADEEERVVREQRDWIEEDGLSRRRIYVPAFPAAPAVSASFVPDTARPR